MASPTAMGRAKIQRFMSILCRYPTFLPAEDDDVKKEFYERGETILQLEIGRHPSHNVRRTMNSGTILVRAGILF